MELTAEEYSLDNLIEDAKNFLPDYKTFVAVSNYEIFLKAIRTSKTSEREIKTISEKIHLCKIYYLFYKIGVAK